MVLAIRLRSFFSNKVSVVAPEHGAAGVLPLMISTFGGALFLFTFYNVAQYTSARSAAEQAARRAARCLSPSDAECREQNVDPANNENAQDWYGYNPAQGPTTTLVDTYAYTGQVFYQNIGAQYNSYEVQTGNPVVMHTEKAVAPVRFYGLLNSYQLLRADLILQIRNRNTGAIKSCRLFEAVELPTGVQLDVPSHYTDTRWCSRHNTMSEISRADGCSDAQNGQWELLPNEYCRLSPPQRNQSDEPWLLLGGSPVCEGEPEAPYQEIPQSIEEVRQLAGPYFGGQAQPGTTGRAHVVTGKRQFVVIEVFSCNPDAFKEKLKSGIRTKDDLKRYFVSYPQRGFPGDERNPDLNGSAGQSAFIYQGAPGVSYLAQQNWTYFEWTRQAEGRRYLERKVCDWMTYDEVKARYPEFSNGEASRYESGSEFGSDVPTYTFYDAPSCLNTVTNDQSYTCPNRSIVGQTGSFRNCAGWEEEQERRESVYRRNVNNAIVRNNNQSWVSFETLPNDFSSEIEPYYSQAYASPAWEFSWSNSDFYGSAIINPLAVRDRLGYNPKQLLPQNQIPTVARTDDKLDPEVYQKLHNAIAYQEQVAAAGDIPYTIVPSKVLEPRTINGVWPFIRDSNGGAVSTVRPYVNSAVNGVGYDFDRNCSPDESCSSGNSFNSMEDALRHYAASVVPEVDIRNAVYRFEFSEQHTGVEFVDRSTSTSYPACTQFRTMCQKDIGDGNKIYIGNSVGMPDSCRNGTYVNCFADYQSGEIQAARYEENFVDEKAKMKAVAEVRKLMPAATLCEDASVPNCVTVNIQKADREVYVSVTFTAPLTTPFKEMISQDTLLVSANKREVIETERLVD